MKKMTYFGLLGASTVLCLSFFQNCSKIATADLSTSMAGEKVSSAGTDSALPNVTSGATDSTGAAPQAPVKSGGSITTPDTGGSVKHTTTEDSQVKSRTKKEKEDKDDVDAIAKCLHGSSSHVGSIKTVNGASELSVDNEDSIENINGHMTVRPAEGKARGSIGKIGNINGSMVLCNMDIDSIENVNGNVKLVNCTIKHGENINGGVKLLANEVE